MKEEKLGKTNQKKADITTLIPDKINFKAKSNTRYFKRPCQMISSSENQFCPGMHIVT